MFEDLDLSSIAEERARQLVQQLLNVLEDVMAALRAAQAENQRLRDELNRLKGEQGAPAIKASTPQPPSQEQPPPVVTPIGKPPPLAVRLAEALPFRRAQGSEERRTLHVRPPAYGRGLPDTYLGRADLWRGGMSRVTSCASANGS